MPAAGTGLDHGGRAAAPVSSRPGTDVAERPEELEPGDPTPRDDPEVGAGAHAAPSAGAGGDGTGEPAAGEAPAGGRAATVATVLVLVACTAFTIAQLQPSLLLAATTPNGGDMGAHVWGPVYLRDHLLPSWQLRGWTQDWYAGYPAYQFYMVVPSLFIVALDAVVPYGVAFKLVSVAGLVAMPTAAWFLGRSLRLPEPTPALFAVATVTFLFDRNFTIYGGNVASTLAGEFAFSISLAFALVTLGVVAQGLETGRRRALAAVLLALTVLCHVIPGIFVTVGSLLLLAVRPGLRRLRWLAGAGLAGAALAAWWTVPFVGRSAWLNDMGWQKRTDVIELLLPGRVGTAIVERTGGVPAAAPADDLTWVLVLALVGAVVAVVRRHRGALFLVVLAAVFAAGVVWVPQSRLWNARLLPFWYLLVRMLAAYAIGEALRAAIVRVDARRRAVVAVGGPLVATAVALAVVGLPLGALPLDQRSIDPATGETWTSWLGFDTTDTSFVPFWVTWNYSGYERKAAWPELEALVATMDDVGADRGCGRALWEYDTALDRFGTPMALMLLPMWTDGCIGSMEGLYFEASATTPYHFMMQSELSAAPSRPERDLPYGSLDVSRGVDHLQMMGVRYYLAESEAAVAQAAVEPRLTEVATSGAWHVYEVDGAADLVAPLVQEPSVLTGDARFGGEAWLGVAAPWFDLAGPTDAPLVVDGPDSWRRVGGDDTALSEQALSDPIELPPVEVSNIEVDDDTVAFDVDRVGVPVLVKVSAFPNWRVDGATGPYRATPNQMVVVPTERHVVLGYGATPVEWAGWALTGGAVLFLAAPAVVARRRRRAAEAPPAAPPAAGPDRDGPDRDGPDPDAGDPDVAVHDPADPDVGVPLHRAAPDAATGPVPSGPERSPAPDGPAAGGRDPDRP